MIKTITNKDYEKALLIAGGKENEIPRGHRRKREEVFYTSLREEVGKCKPRTSGKNISCLYTYTRNQGSARFPEYVTAVAVRPVYGTEKETEKTFDGIRKCNILCFIKK